SYQWRAQLDAGAVLAFGSDAPIDPFDTFRGLHAAVTRRKPDHSYGGEGWYPEAAVTIEEALTAYTLAPAYAAGTEDHSGKLARGYLADLVVLDRNLMEISADE